MTTFRAPIAVADREGEPLWFNHDLLVFKATSRRQTAHSSCWQTSQRGKMTPLHRHPNEDETFIVLDGELILNIDGTNHPAGREASSRSARLTHAFVVTADIFKGLILFTPGNEPCEAWLRAAANPARLRIARTRAAGHRPPNRGGR